MFADEVKYFCLKHVWKRTLINIFVTRVYLTVCSYHVTCSFQSESTPYSCLNVKELLTQNKHGIYLSVRLRTKWLWIRIPLQSLWYIFDHIFGPKKDNVFYPVFVFHRVISNGISDFVLYFKNEGLSISWVSRGNPILLLKNVLKIKCSPVSLVGRNLIFLKRNGSIRDLGGKFRQKQIYLFGAFWGRSIIKMYLN